MNDTNFPKRKELLDARARISPFINPTPILTSTFMNDLTGCDVYFKCENFQKVGAFKYRGATNAILQLSPEELSHGVATHSSGNHAQALALAARVQGVPAYIVMPRTAPAVKVAAVKGYGAEITFCEPTLEARETTLAEVVARTGATEIHPFDNHEVICGQSTAAQELLEDVPNLEILMTPVGGGGLLSGTALTAHFLGNNISVVAGEPKGADDAYRSLQAGHLIPSVNPKTIADGLLTSLSERTFAIIQEYVDEIITVSEDEIISTMKLVWERMKIIIEPSSAVPLAALIQQKLRFSDKRVGIIISGGNVDLGKLPF